VAVVVGGGQILHDSELIGGELVRVAPRTLCRVPDYAE
jgi:hypothetical protein